MSPKHLLRRSPWLLLLGALVLFARHAESASADPAARGLDLLVHLPEAAIAQASLPVQVQAYGFAVVDRTAPLPNATVEAAWDPESLGQELAKAPAPVTTTTDGAGRATIIVSVPPGPAHQLRLLVSVRHGEHQRTRGVPVERRGPTEVTLQVAERQVVPGSSITAWVLVRSAATGRPAARAPVELALLEGGVARSTKQLRTDAAGSAVGRVTIPFVRSANWRWTLVAREPGSAERDAARDEVVLNVREETPGTPRLEAECAEAAIRAGESVGCTVRLRDAAGSAVGGFPVRYWSGPKGTKPPDDPKRWLEASTGASTDATGRLRIELHAPSTVAPVVGTRLTVVVRTRFDGRDLQAEAHVDVRHAAPNISLLPEGGAITGGLAQHLLLRVRDERDKPVAAKLRVEGDGLDVEATTDAHGEADVLWRTPKDVGAFRNVGPCAGEVASAVRVTPRERMAAFGQRTEPFEICVRVDRDATAVMRLSPLVVTAGERVRIVLEPGRRPWSVVARAKEGEMATSQWIADGAEGAEITIPAGASGPWIFTAVSPGDRRPSDVATGAVLVRPALLPRIEARLAGGRLVPGGVARVEVELADGAGKGLPGTVAALVQDRFGGGSLAGLYELDARRRLCRSVQVDTDRCDELLEAGAPLDPLRRGLLGQLDVSPVLPRLDPAAHVEEELREAFRSVVHSLEGAVLESTESPERLRDARRLGADGRASFNPELWTLVTAAMEEPPTTPGGEPFTLADLVAIDRQISFDNVARRVTRLKLFRALAAMREQIRARDLGPGEPALRDPAALLRRLVRAQSLRESDLLDPWGGTLGFVAGPAPGLPFLSVRGFELRSPGPDGRLGTGDDVRDPFERVLGSKTPYAEAVGEDELVDARLDMQVADATVQSWSELIERLTGSSLGGRGEGIGLGSIGTIGHGSGTGTGQGFGSGRGRLGFATSLRGAAWVLPRRTDPSGKITIEVPLGDDETTWRVGVVGLPDAGEGAVATLDVPVSLPLSARVEVGAGWIAGDEAETRVTLRNRTAAAIRAELAVRPEGPIVLVRAADRARTVTVPAQGAAEALVRVRAMGTGNAVLEVSTKAPGVPEDRYRHQWLVAPRGEPTDVVQMAWVDRETRVALPKTAADEPWLAPATLVVTRGHEPLLMAALEALEPDLAATPDGLAQAELAALAIRRAAIATGGEGSMLARRSLDVSRRARGRLSVHAADEKGAPPWKQIAARETLPERKGAKARPEIVAVECPPASAGALPTAIDWLELEPPTRGGAFTPCWDEFVADTLQLVAEEADAEQLAAAALGMLDSPHRKPIAASLVARLEEQVALAPSGFVRLPAALAGKRAARATIYAALLKAAAQGIAVRATPDKLFGWLALQGDARGGYGSARATRAAVQALLSLPQRQAATSVPAAASPLRPTPSVTIREGNEERRVALDAAGQATVALRPTTTEVTVRTDGEPLLVRLERKKLRPWTRPPATSGAPVRIELEWPAKLRAGASAPLRVTLRNQLDREARIDLRLPLPAGARLAAPLDGARQVQGVLSFTRRLDDSTIPVVVDVPIRFGLSGRFTMAEAQATLLDEESERVVVPARPIVVE